MKRDDLPKTLPEAHALIEALLTRLDALEKVVTKQAQRIEELERRLGQNSQNSSKPPSSDPPDEPSGSSKRKSGRKPGGQPGHEGHQRALLPAERVDRLEQLWPERCDHCERDLRHGKRIEVGEPQRHQVAELPTLRAEVVEYVMHAQLCEGCCRTTKAELPPGVPQSAFGPRLQAHVAILSGLYRLSKRSVHSILRDFFGVPMSLGAIIACERRTSAALAAPVAEAAEYIQRQAVLNADETGWRQRSRRAWLWVAVTSSVTVFMIHAGRGAAAAEKLLGKFAGYLGTDRWCVYARHAMKKRQLCWAHLLRAFEGFAEYRGKPGVIGDALVLLTREQLFSHWHRVRDGTLTRAAFQREIKSTRAAIEELLERGRVCGAPKVQATCRDLLRHREALWTFVRVPGVEPTNNAAERALRPAVIHRKTSFGTHSEDGSRFVERMLTVTATLRQQERDLVAYVVEQCERALLDRRPRSILPSAHVISTADLARLAGPTP